MTEFIAALLVLVFFGLVWAMAKWPGVPAAAMLTAVVVALYEVTLTIVTEIKP